MMHTSAVRLPRRLVAGAFVLASLTACEDPFSPYWDRGTYDLRFANNRHIPAFVSEGPGTSFVQVTGGSLTLRRDHSYQLVVNVRERDALGVTDYSVVFADFYENDYRTLYLNYVDARGYSRVITANWRDGRIEAVVPGIDGGYGVLCSFEDY